jgi:L-asparaginase II
VVTATAQLRTGPGEPLAWVVRGGVAESVHTGHLLVADDGGAVLDRRGDPDAVVFARSSLKPLQAWAMLRAGLDLDGRELAIACGSHAGSADHQRVASAILADAGLGVEALQNTPSFPQDRDARAAAQGPTSLAQNCSGKHAAMLATCVAAGWDTATYRAVDHPLQVAIAALLAEVTGETAAAVAVDGCGAPLFSCSLRGLARAFARLGAGAPGTLERRVVDAMRAHPDMVAGDGRMDTDAMRTVDGLACKSGAEGVLAAVLPGRGVVVAKVADGSHRPNPVLLAAGLRTLGVAGAWDWAEVPVLGHGEPVGAVVAAQD